MHTPVGLYAAHGHQDNADDRAAGMTSKRLHRFVFDRNKKANPHLMQSADYHIYNMVAHQDPYAMPGGTDTQAMIIEEACGLHRKVRCPEIHMACAAPYLYAEDGNSEVSRASYQSETRGNRNSGYGYAGTPYSESQGSSRFAPSPRNGGRAYRPDSYASSEGYSRSSPRGSRISEATPSKASKDSRNRPDVRTRKFENASSPRSSVVSGSEVDSRLYGTRSMESRSRRSEGRSSASGYPEQRR
jgi:hypothetical protein|mmetsp:Transcript_82176/g.129411  ORF Transcript_82176/g.129411 Transcript_82176/m.129411 type:complete len:244 (+) Transcript_82176:46-777(+)